MTTTTTISPLSKLIIHQLETLKKSPGDVVRDFLEDLIRLPVTDGFDEILSAVDACAEHRQDWVCNSCLRVKHALSLRRADSSLFAQIKGTLAELEVCSRLTGNHVDVEQKKMDLIVETSRLNRLVSELTLSILS